jgi:hypothetical protein
MDSWKCAIFEFLHFFRPPQKERPARVFVHVFRKGTPPSIFCVRNAAISSAEHDTARITAKRIKTLLRGGAARKRFAAYTCALHRATPPERECTIN